ncbi:IclR family transcriptional regulator [Pseudonocardia sp. NPDC046786]|uniref:IclR family transcriptional regulator n=1 Tax=Pseudonocardia sp. NPDC046786 TaxID=3155471 RepID=UPI003407AA5F
MTETNRDGTSLRGVDRAVQVLRLIAERGVVRLSEVSAELDLALGSTHRLLSSLEHTGMLARVTGSKLYRAGPALAELATTVAAPRVPDDVIPHLRELARSCGETAHLVQLVGRSVEFVANGESDRSTRVTTRLGMTMPAHATSGGKALLARYTDDTVGHLYAGRPLRRMTDRTITEVPALLADLHRVRERGYATIDGESEPDVRGIGLAVTDQTALVVGGPRHRIPAADLPYLASLLQDTAGAVLAALPEERSWCLGRP